MFIEEYGEHVSLITTSADGTTEYTKVQVEDLTQEIIDEFKPEGFIYDYNGRNAVLYSSNSSIGYVELPLKKLCSKIQLSKVKQLFKLEYNNMTQLEQYETMLNTAGIPYSKNINETGNITTIVLNTGVQAIFVGDVLQDLFSRGNKTTSFKEA